MSLAHVSPGDEVAILPTEGSPPQETIGIGTVEFVDEQIVRLTDHRIYSRRNRCGLTFRSCGFIEPATDLHREYANIEA